MQHERRKKADDNPPIKHAVIHHGLCCAQQNRHRAHGQHPDHRQDNAQQDAEERNHGEILVCVLLVALAQHAGDQRRAACAEHKAHCAQNDEKRHNQVDGRERRFSGEIRHEQPVHHAVDGREHHHDNRRQDEAEQPSVGKVVR